ncbi:hypothetical protein BHWA1_01689 [Brachyspira hyodysenteriae WA1]|uniref:Uncharacterized protein n=1 Tax=Brachyspira hyodysenteriae (strain ATCC 49526 / WA1) TaxID=565034 RepID=A0A3B6VA44_BRAHW|nr:hypothetical protein BHWA1_01689 [Brachyspira hyodysenteriae WA1]
MVIIILISVSTGKIRDYKVHIVHLRKFQKGQIEKIYE